MRLGLGWSLAIGGATCQTPGAEHGTWLCGTKPAGTGQLGGEESTIPPRR